MRFADVVGHEDVKRRLREMVDASRVPHALMLSGRAGIGKMRMARAFVQYLVCSDRHDGDSCGHCPACRQVQAFNFPDVNYVFPIVRRQSEKLEVCDDYSTQWHTFLTEHSYMPFSQWMDIIKAGNSQPVIYKDESAEILRKLSLSAYGSRYKVMLIWLPEKLNPTAANRLLKIIEEPSDDTVFLMVSNEPGQILPTIMSRTQNVVMLPLPPEVIAMQLQREHGLDAGTSVAVARLSEGTYTRALECLGQQEEPARFRNLFQQMMRAAYARDVVMLKHTGEEIAGMGRDMSRRFLAYAAAMLRENFIYNMGNRDLNLLTAEEEAFSSRFAPFVNPANISAMTEAVNSASEDIARNANGKIVCFDLMLHLMMNIRKKP